MNVLMNGGKRSAVKAIARMRPMSYSGRSGELEQIHKRLMAGRKSFEQVVSQALSSAMGISTLDVTVTDEVRKVEAVTQELVKVANRVQKTSDMTSNISGEVSRAHEEMTRDIVSASEEAEDVIKRLEEDDKQLSGVIRRSEETIESSRTMKEDMQQLMDVIGRMNEVIASINAISSQTNLLALNASIEAARAGEAGRGFAVVAEEIRQLADETKGLTDNMGEFVKKIRNASELSVHSMQDTVEALEVIGDGLKQAGQSNRENKERVGDIVDSISSIAAVSEEISSSFHEMENRIGEVAQESVHMRQEAEQLEEVRANLSKVLSPIRGLEDSLDNTVKKMGSMSQDAFYMPDNDMFNHFVKSAIGAHESWLHTLEEMATSGEIKPLQTNDKKCGFGHFYYSVEPRNEEVLAVWKGLAQKHKTFHGYAVRVMEDIAKNGGQAKALLKEAEALSKDLIKDFKTIIETVDRLSERNIRVFE